MIGKIIQPELEAFIASRDFSGLQAIFKEMLVPDIAEVIEDIKPTDRAVLFRLLPKQSAMETFEYLDGTAQRELLAELGKAEVVSLLDEMHPDDRTALLEDLPGTIARDLIGSLSPDERRVAQALLGYPENSIGRLMTPEYLAVRPETTIAAVMENLRKHGRDSETFDVIYIVNTKGVLLDDVRLRELLLAPPDVSIGSIADGIVVSLNVTEDREASIQMFQHYGRTALPVVDKESVLIGIVTVDDALAVAQEEHTEDIHKFGGMEAIETPYAATPLLTLVWKRAGWLVVLFLGEMLTATAHGLLRERDRPCRGLGVVRPVDHLQRGQFRVAGRDPDHPCDGTRRDQAVGLVACHETRAPLRTHPRSHPRIDRIPSHRSLGRHSRRSTASTGSSWASPSREAWWAW